jgi:hypothetical protein
MKVGFMGLKRPHHVLIGRVHTINHLEEWKKLVDVLVIFGLDLVFEIVKAFELHVKLPFRYADP